MAAVIAFLALGFVVGAIPFGYVLGRLIHNTDIRQHGSQNIGATNAARSFGLGFGLAVLGLDALKGWVMTGWAWTLFPHQPLFVGLTGTAAICGHVFSPFLRFRGGKGVATGLGAVVALAWPAAIVGVTIFLIVALWSRIVSVASLLGMVGVLGTFAFLHQWEVFWAFGVPAVGVSLWAHRANWLRLWKGQESRFQFSRKSGANRN